LHLSIKLIKENKMISLKEFKAALPNDCNLTEEEILKLQDNQDQMAEIMFNMWLEEINKK